MNERFEYGIFADATSYNQRWWLIDPGPMTGTTDERYAARFTDCQAADKVRLSMPPFLGHLPWYIYVWSVSDPAVAPTTRPQGCVCHRCNSLNAFAEPNLPDGKYECYTCRRYQKPY